MCVWVRWRDSPCVFEGVWVYVCLWVSVCERVIVSLRVYACVYLFVSVWVYAWESDCKFVSVCASFVCVSLCVSLWVYVCLCVCVFVCKFVSVCVFVCEREIECVFLDEWKKIIVLIFSVVERVRKEESCHAVKRKRNLEWKNWQTATNFFFSVTSSNLADKRQIFSLIVDAFMNETIDGRYVETFVVF